MHLLAHINAAKRAQKLTFCTVSQDTLQEKIDEGHIVSYGPGGCIPRGGRTLILGGGDLIPGGGIPLGAPQAGGNHGCSHSRWKSHNA